MKIGMQPSGQAHAPSWVQPGRLQRTTEPIKVKKTPKCPVKNRLEMYGNTGKQAEKTGADGIFRKETEINGKTDQILGSGPKGRGESR